MKYFLFIISFFLIVSCGTSTKDDAGFSGIVPTDGQGNIVGRDIDEQWSPRSNALLTSNPAYPNPFSSFITIKFTLTEKTNVEINILDRPDHVLKTIRNKAFAAGAYSVPINPDGLKPALQPGRVYQIQISSNDDTIFGNIRFQQ